MDVRTFTHQRLTIIAAISLCSDINIIILHHAVRRKVKHTTGGENEFVFFDGHQERSHG